MHAHSQSPATKDGCPSGFAVLAGSAFEAWWSSSGLPEEHNASARAGWTAYKNRKRQKWGHPSFERRFRKWQKEANDKSRTAADFHCRRWDEIEEALVMDESNSVADLARRLGRTRHAVKSKRKMLRKLNASRQGRREETI